MDTMLAAAPSLRVMGEEEAIEIGFPALAAFHGQSALAMLAITFQGLRGAFDILSPAVPPPRAEIAVVSGHPGPGVRDAFEFRRALEYVCDLSGDHFDHAFMVVIKSVVLNRVERKHADESVIKKQWSAKARS